MQRVSFRVQLFLTGAGWLVAAGAALAQAALPTGEMARPKGVPLAAGSAVEATVVAAEKIQIVPISRFAAPLTLAVSSPFGVRSDPFRGGRAFHAGVDLAAPLGSVVRAAAAGRVSVAGVVGGYGRLVVLTHAAGVETRYGHLATILVAPGAWVARGEAIALVGATGRATGPHLHFEARSSGRPFDPLGPAPVVYDAAWRFAPLFDPQPAAPWRSEFARARDGH